MSSVLSYIYSIIPFTSVFNFLYEKVVTLLCKTTINSICIPFIDETLLENLNSKSVYIVNLDKEISNTLDNDEKNQSAVGALISPRIVYNKCITVVEELIDVIIHSSGEIKAFLFISSDYRLLKYSNTCGDQVFYAVPSDAYYQVLKELPNWNDKLYQKIKTDLVNRKGNKLVIYHSFVDLQNIIVKQFPGITIKI